MVNVEEAVIAKLKIHNHNFEILVDCEKAIAFKDGKKVNLDDILSIPKVFSDAKKGLEASQHLIEEVFNTTDIYKVAERIIKEGHIQLTVEYKKKLRERTKKRIIDIIHRNAVDPKTHLPHPPQRIENAMDEANVTINELESPEKQVQKIIKKLRVILPLKFETKEIAIKIPPQYAAKSYNIVHQFGSVLKDEWQNDGSWIVVIEIPGGLEQDFYQKINELCHGEVEMKVLRVK